MNIKRYLKMLIRPASYKKLIDMLPKTIMGFFVYFLCPRKTIVYLISTQRSGSTLLKALLAEAPDISNIPEIKFQNHYEKYNYFAAYYMYYRLSTKNIIVMKFPAILRENDKYPNYYVYPKSKVIVLIRDVTPTVASIMKMISRLPKIKKKYSQWDYRYIAEDYWCHTYEKILNKIGRDDGKNVIIIRYEEVVRDPIGITSRIFAFLGSRKRTGVSKYRQPENYSWEWGKDDGGEVIHTLSVNSGRKMPRDIDQHLIDIVENSERVINIRKKYGYEKKENDQKCLN